jgi:hypothetical protein
MDYKRRLNDSTSHGLAEPASIAATSVANPRRCSCRPRSAAPRGRRATGAPRVRGAQALARESGRSSIVGGLDGDAQRASRRLADRCCRLVGEPEELRTVLAVGLTKFAVLFECFHYSDCTIRLLYYVWITSYCVPDGSAERERECVCR